MRGGHGEASVSVTYIITSGIRPDGFHIINLLLVPWIEQISLSDGYSR